MIWLTFITGLLIFSLGAGARFLIPILEWQALIPIVLGLGYLTLAEGLRSQQRRRRLFHFAALLWTFLTLAVTVPLARLILSLWKNEPAIYDGQPVRAELVSEYACVFLVALLYLMWAGTLFLRKPRATASTPESAKQGR